MKTEDEIIIEKNVKLFYELLGKTMLEISNKNKQKFERPVGVSNNFFLWTMIILGIICGICTWLSV